MELAGMSNTGHLQMDQESALKLFEEGATIFFLDRTEPANKKISSVADLIPGEAESSNPEPDVKKRRVRRVNLEDSLLPSMHPRPGTELRFTQIPELSYPDGATASEITRYSLDMSFVLGQLLKKWEKSDELLGEMQMAFLCFLVGQVYPAFEQWKKLVHIFCSSDELLLQNPQLFIDFIGILYFQMQEVPADFFVDIVSQDNFLTQTLRVFFGNVLENDQLDQRLRKRTLQLQQYLTHRFQWDFSTDLEDDCPVVVELDEDAPVIVELDDDTT
nr:EOG090X0AVR [Sida crystallina]